MTRLAPAALLLAYAAAFAWAALGGGLLVFDDHPGQLYRAWHVLAAGPLPWAWEPGWWTGYPELQFYPPAFAYAVAALHRASLGAFSLAGAYQVMLWVAWIAPGATTFLLLARALGDGWRALPGAFVALTLSAGAASGVEGGVHEGRGPARLAWALLPRLALALAPWIEGRARVPWLAVPLVAIVVLTHPAHLPAAVALVAAAVLTAGRRGIARRASVAGLVLALGAAGTAFWTLPLLTRLAETRALAWGRLADAVPSPLVHPLVAALAVFALAALGTARSPLSRALAWWPWLAGLLVAADALALEPLGLRFLPADRLVDGAALALVVAAAIGLASTLERAGVTGARAPVALGAVLALAGLSVAGGTLSLWPARRADWPVYGNVARGMRLDALWTTLAAGPPGRVLFVRSGVPLRFGTEWWRPHTHVTALTPLHGRAIVNGTFTHPSPVAAAVYRGDDRRGPITTLVERLDGVSLFGIPLERLDAATLDRWAARLGVGVIVAVEDDRPRLAALDDRARFTPLPAPAPFLAWARRAPVAPPLPVGPGRWRVVLRGAPGAWAPAGLAYYPLWRATSGGRALAIRRGAVDQLEVLLPDAEATVDLTYAPGAPEFAGVVVSIAGVLAWLAAWRRDSLTRR